MSGDGFSVDLGRCAVIKPLLVALPVVEHLDVIEQDRAHLRAREPLEVTVDVAELAFERPAPKKTTRSRRYRNSRPSTRRTLGASSRSAGS